MSGLRGWGSRGGLAVVALVAGCSEELGPERWETTRVSGVLTLGRRPVTGGWVEFLPTGGTIGTMRSAPLGPDGRFTVEGVAVGLNRIGIDGALAGIPAIMRHHFDPLSSPIRRTVRTTSEGPLEINLLDEYALWFGGNTP